MSFLAQLIAKASSAGIPKLAPDTALSQVLTVGATSLTLSSKPTVTIIGDSEVKNNILSGYSIAPAATIGGISDVANLFFQRGFPTGNATVEFDFPNLRIRVAANGETNGAWVSVAGGGVFDVASSGGKSMRIYTCARTMTASVTTTANVTGNIYHEHLSGSAYGMLDALTGHRLVFADPLLGISGDYITDVYARRQQILNQGSSVIWSITGTNSLIALGQSAALTLADELANYLFFNAAGKIYISTAVMPRFAADGSDGSYTTANGQKIQNYNAALYALARTYPNWFVVDADEASDATNNSKAKNGTTSDGLHAKAGMMIFPARQVADIINYVWPPFHGSPRLKGGAALYNSSTNPKGNLINNSAGSFINTGGTAGTGITAAAAWVTLTAYSVEDFMISGGKAYRCVVAGTTGATAPVHTSGVAVDGTAQWQYITSGASVGIPANWSFQRSVGSTAVGKAFKVADGTADWFALFITAAADDEIVYGYTDQESFTNFVTGDEIDAGIDFEVIGPGCAGVKMDLNPDGSMTTTSSISANQMDQLISGVTGKCSPYIPRGLIWLSTSVTGCRFRAYTRTQAGCAYLWKMSNAVIRKI